MRFDIFLFLPNLPTLFFKFARETIYQILMAKNQYIISIYLTSLGVKAKGGRTENDGALYQEL